MSGFFPFGGQSGAPGSGLPAGTAAGDYLRWNGSIWVPVIPRSVSTFKFSCSTLLQGTGTTYLPGADGNGNSISSDTGGGYNARAGDVVLGFDLRHSVAVAGDTLTYELLRNGAATGITGVLASGALGPTIVTSSLALNANDLITVLVSGLTANRAIRPVLLMRIGGLLV